MTNNANPKLPDEVVSQIEKEAEAHNDRLKEHAESEKDVAYAQGFAEGWHEGATSYATKLLQEKEAVKILQKTCAKDHAEIGELKKENEKLIATATGWRPLLEEVLKLDDFEIAHISDELFEKIKHFLYGE